MSVADLFLGCFLVGFLLTVVFAVFGHFHLGGGEHLDLPHGHAHLPAGHDCSTHHGSGHGFAPINMMTIMAFVMVFGGVGYVLTRLAWWTLLLILPVAIAGGVAGAWLIWRVLRFMLKGERVLAGGSLVGTYGWLAVGIRPGGTGEMMYSLNGVRQTCPAVVDGGGALPRGTDVVVLRYEQGVAHVVALHEGPAGEPPGN